MVSTQERERRYAALRALMQDREQRALILAGNAEAMQRGYIRYVTDWRIWGGKAFVVLPVDADPVLILGSGSQGYWAEAVGWVTDVRSAIDMVGEVIDMVRQAGLEDKSIGVVGMGQVISFQDATRLLHELDGATFTDVTVAVDDLMAVKSDEEIERAAETYNIIARALDRFKEALAPGRTEREVMAEAIHYLAAHGCVDGIAHLTNGTPPYLRPPTDRRISADDILKVSLEFAGPAGYWIELAGVYSFQPPPDRARRHFETTLKAMDRVAATLKPGATGGDLSRTIRQTFEEDGWTITGRAIWDGHAIGLNVIRPPIGLPDSIDPVREGMIMNIHPGLLVDEDQWGVYIQDNFVVTPEGGRPLGDYQYRWHVLPT